jgi:hypothetical protein
MKNYELMGGTFEHISPEEFLRLLKGGRNGMKSVTVIPPSLNDNLDDDDFGSVLIEHPDPVYEVRLK